MEIREQMKLFHENPVVGWHEHISLYRGYEKLDMDNALGTLKVMDELGIDKIVTSIPVVDHKRGDIKYAIAANNLTYEATKLSPDRIFGLCYVHPGQHELALREIERCVNELGFVGVKLYYDYFMDDPIQHPIIEKCIELDIPILMHSMKYYDEGNKLRQPLTSNGVHMANAARKFPDATFIMGHFTICDWKWSIKAIADCPNVYTDISGSNFDRPGIEEAVSLLGANRLLWGTDGAWSAGVGKLLGAELSEEDKKTILSGRDFERFLCRKKKNLKKLPE